MTTASAPGKIILFGEHAVVYNRPALAVPLSQVQAQAEVNPSNHNIPGTWIDAPGISIQSSLIDLPAGNALGSVITNVFNSLGIQTPPDIDIRITSNIPVASGLGSGAAVSVAIIRALSTYFGHSLSDQQVNELCYLTEKIHHGTPSGIDNTVITYASPVYFVKGQAIETFLVGSPFTLVIADTGIAAPTRESVNDVRKLWQADPVYWEQVFDQVGKIVQKARQAIEGQGWRSLGPLMNANHTLLQQMSVSSPELDRLVQAARSAGALGAKLSGGGRGGNMIALADQNPESAANIAAALCSAGAKNTIITTVQ
jgi:mevalonate kinase